MSKSCQFYFLPHSDFFLNLLKRNYSDLQTKQVWLFPAWGRPYLCPPAAQMLNMRNQVMAVELGLPLAEEKTEGPIVLLSFGGIELDTWQQTCYLPINKLEDLPDMIWDLVPCSKVTLKELQKLVGHLNFACKVVAPGRSFIGRLDMDRSWVMGSTFIAVGAQEWGQQIGLGPVLLGTSHL